jgi:hypothetical protein
MTYRSYLFMAFTAAALLAAPAAHAFEEMACKKDADCTVARGPCDKWTPVHVKQKEELLKNFGFIQGCKTPGTPPPAVTCQNNLCRAAE